MDNRDSVIKVITSPLGFFALALLIVKGFLGTIVIGSSSDAAKVLGMWMAICAFGGIVVINSDNDPWKCDDKQGKIMADNTGGKLIVLHEGHMGSLKFDQPYKEFPLLIDLID